MSRYVYYYLIDGHATCRWATGPFDLQAWNRFDQSPSECLWRIPNGIGDWSCED